MRCMQVLVGGVDMKDLGMQNMLLNFSNKQRIVT